MSDMGVTQRVAAILAADAVGYSRLMADDEPATIEALDAARAVFAEHIEANQGRVVDTAGDSVLAVFQTTVGAVHAAVAIQGRLSRINESLPDERRMRFRIGIHLGDIHEKADGTVYGDGINVASRLQATANPGGINVSGSVSDTVRGRLGLPFGYLGEHKVKNIADPVRVYRLGGGNATEHWTRFLLVVRRLPAIGAAILVVLVAFAAWQLYSPAPSGMTDGAARAVALPQGPSVIVLPFTEIGADPSQVYFGDGLTLDLTTALTGFPDLRVLDFGTAAAYRDTNPDVGGLRSELGVDYVLKGTVQRDGSSIRVNLHLLSTDSQVAVWGRRFDEDLSAESLFNIQDQVTEAVIREVAQSDAAIRQHERQRAQRIPAPDLDAYDCVLRAEHATELLEPQVNAQARNCLEQAVAAYPDFARAWSRLAFLYQNAFKFGWDAGPDPLGRAIAAARQAIALDPADVIAHITTAYIAYAKRDAAATRLAIDKALSLAPDLAEIVALSADMLSCMGEYDYANQLYNKAVALNPGHPSWYAWTPFRKAFAEGDWRAAIDLMTKAEQGAPDFYWHPAALATSHALAGDLEAARAKLARTLELKPDFAATVRDELAFFNLGPKAARVPNAAIRGFVLAGLDVSDAPIIPVDVSDIN